MVVQNIYSVSSGIGSVSEIWSQDKDKEINKGKDQRQKKKTNHRKLSHKFKKIIVIHLRLLLTHNAKLDKFIN